MPTENYRLTKTQWLAILVPLAFLIVMAWTHRWMADDAFIDVRVVHNVLAGYGPVYNVGERVEAYTNPLWVLLLVVFRGLLPILSVEWWAMVLGIVLTAMGVVLGSTATARLGRRHATGLVIPLGALIVASVDGMWDFTTSGLETGLIFGWIGLSWWLVVRYLNTGRGLLLSAFVISLGPEARPDMVLLAAGFIVSLILIARHRAGDEWRWLSWRTMKIGLAFVAIPVIGELFRIAYFGLYLPNTALVKSAFSPYLSQGRAYLRDFVLPNALWFPGVVVLALGVSRMMSWSRRGWNIEVAVFTLVAGGAVADGVYVIFIGGDFMHDRMLLPTFFLISMLTWVDLKGKVEKSVALSSLVAWAVVSAGFLRYTVVGIGDNFVANERGFYITASGVAHPVNLSSYRNFYWYQAGAEERAKANSLPPGVQVLTEGESAIPITTIGPTPGATYPSTYIHVHSALPERVFVGTANIGMWGAEAGPKVYIFDQLDLANPIGSHFSDLPQLRPGHSDPIGTSWMVARFAPKGVTLGFGAEVAVERRVLGCQPLSGYLHTITEPFGWGTVVSDFEHFFTWTTMKFSSNPWTAERQLCG